jgi:hypothetical protein
MKKHYIQDQFLNELIGQTTRSVLVIAGVVGLIIAGLTVEPSSLVSNFQDAMALLDSHA